MSEWAKLKDKFPHMRIVLIFAVLPKNVHIDRTGWSAIHDGRIWGFFDLAKMLRVDSNTEVDERYRLMIQDMKSDATSRGMGLAPTKRYMNSRR